MNSKKASALIVVTLASLFAFTGLFVKDVHCMLADPFLTFNPPQTYLGSPVVLEATIQTTAL